jgi:hypothetical protein
MSLRSVLASLNAPPLVAAAGAVVLSGLSIGGSIGTTVSVAALQGLNVTAFLISVGAVSVPGRIDGQQDAEMRQGSLNPNKPAATGQSELTPLSPMIDIYSPARGRSLVSPSGWAFAIWGPIYVGEACFVAGQLLPAASGLAAVLPQVTVPFVAAHLFQSLWCASFRPSYSDSNSNWAIYISPLMLAGTALSLSQIHAVACSSDAAGLGWFFLPMTLHFGWTTAATLVNLNGSIASNRNISDPAVIAVGHSSALVATLMGVGLTLTQASPAYGLTLAWALAACADGMSKRIANTEAPTLRESLKTGADVQNKLCWVGAAACAACSLYVSLFL